MTPPTLDEIHAEIRALCERILAWRSRIADELPGENEPARFLSFVVNFPDVVEVLWTAYNTLISVAASTAKIHKDSGVARIANGLPLPHKRGPDPRYPHMLSWLTE